MNKHTRIARLVIAALMAAGLVLVTAQPSAAGPGSPGPKGTMTLSTTSR